MGIHLRFGGAYAALLADGQVAAWGDFLGGGHLGAARSQLRQADRVPSKLGNNKFLGFGFVLFRSSRSWWVKKRTDPNGLSVGISVIGFRSTFHGH